MSDEDDFGTSPTGDKDTRTRAWFMTINNYSPEEIAKVKASKSVYTCVAEETCPTTGTPHIHAWMYFKSDKCFSKMKKDYPRADLRHSHANRGAPARDYILGQVKKKGYEDNPTFYECGEMPEQGKRSDIAVVREMINDGANMKDVVAIASSYQSVRMAEVCLKYFEPSRNERPIVRWYWGPAGCGKTWQAKTDTGFFTNRQDVYFTLDTIKWWEGYDAHTNVILDDIRGDFAKFHQMLKLFDENPYTVECKGGSRQFRGKLIIVTSPYPPEQVFGGMEDISQLLDRLEEIREFRGASKRTPVRRTIQQN